MTAAVRAPLPASGRLEDTASVRALISAARAVADGPVDERGSTPLEWRQPPAKPARVVTPVMLEAGGAREVAGDVAPAFGGFLDGVQESHVIHWLASGAPLVLAVVGAVVLERGDDRRLTAWKNGARIRRALVLPRALAGPSAWSALDAQGLAEDSGAGADDRHPEALLSAAVHRVEELRAVEERALAEAWARDTERPLAIDGSITGLGAAAHSALAVGIVKSHRTLHADPAALAALFALPVSARSAVFSIATSGSRAAAHSWYLRLRAASASDPLHGLVRVEVAVHGGDIGARADAVSRWVLAERTPIALPDARWDVMAYGIARCEAYLKRGLALRARA